MASSARKGLIIVGVVALLGLTAVLLFGIVFRDKSAGDKDDKDDGDLRPKTAVRADHTPRTNEHATPPPRHDPPRIARATSGSGGGGGTATVRGHTPAQAVDAGPIVNGRRVPLRRYAPPVFPAHIKSIKDPAKRMQALRMHRVARMKVRISILQRRKSILDRTLDAARKSGNNDRVAQVEQQSQQLDKAIGEANKRLDEAKQAAGVP
ncbi:MAG: hypothetical protein KC503_20150 [Myxococcales bacterium]|nr:hypothetical protein [Myxococcales bacterium]